MNRFAFLVRFLAFSAVLFAGLSSDAEAQTFRRKPFLQLGTPTSASVCWRLTTQTSLTVRYGTDSTNLNLTSAAGVADSNACVSLSGLSPSTKYYYKLYNGATEVPGATEQYIVTHPVENSTARHRFWVIGDFGEGDALQAGVRRGFVSANGGNHIDGILMLGDNAYSNGTDAEFTNKLFAMYPDIMANTFSWPVIGNHEAPNLTAGYLTAFTLPSNGQAGGVASGTERYYSFDYGNIHFVNLDSESSDRTIGGAQYSWLLQDLQATTKKWLVVSFHHPPYTRGSHNSESPSEPKHNEMRLTFMPLLESYGVDLVLGGHSHNYERSYLLDSAYTTTATTTEALRVAWFAANRSRIILDSSSGDPEDQGPYRKYYGGNQGAVYSVVGSSANLEGSTGVQHPMYYTQQFRLGSAIMEVEGDVMTVKFYDSSGIYHDRYQIVKSPAPFTVTYAANPATYTVGTAIATNTASTTRTGVTFSVNPALPAGLSLNASTGAITGTPTGTAAAANYTVTATAGEETTQAVVNITVNVFVLTYAANPATYVLNTAIATNTATPTGAGFSYSVNPSLPAGLSLNASTGAITGTPTVLSAASDYTVTATYGSVSDDATVSIAVLTALPSDFSTWGSNVDIQLNTTSAAAGVATQQTGFPMLVRLNGRHAAVFSGAQSGGTDVRFTNANGVRLPTQVESWSFVPGDTSAAIWVRLDTVRANTTTTVRMYWNKPGALADTLANQVFDTLSYVAVWHMGSTGNASDATSNGFTATNVSTTAGIGAIGGARTFNGSSQYLTVANTTKFNFTANLTLSAWVNATTWNGASSSRRILQKGTGTNAAQYGLRDNSTGSHGVDISNTFNAGFTNADTLVWVLIHGTYGDGSVRLFYNGVEKASTVKSGAIATSSGALDIGRSTGSTTAANHFSGRMDEVRVLKVRRPADWIMLEYRTQKPGTFPIYGLAYSNMSPSYTVGQGISSNSVSSLSGTATRFTASGLPAGLSIHGTTGAITGTPSAAGAYGVTVTAYGDSAWSTTATVNMTVILPPPVFTYASPQSYGFGSAITTLNPNSTGSTVTAWSISPALPTGLSFNTSTGAITGTPAAVTSATAYTIIGTNANGADSAIVNIATPAVVPNAPTGVTAVPGGTRAFVSWVAASFNGGAPITGYTVTASPGGATCVWTSGPLECIVTGLSNGTGYTFSVTAQNSVGTGTASAASSSITPGPAPVISYAGSPYTFPMGVEVSQPVVNAGTAVSGWSIAPNLAANTGLQINPITGRIVGTPVYLTSATSYTITAVNAAGVRDRATISIATPAVAPNISYASPQIWPMGTAIATFAPSNSGGAVLSWSIAPNLTANTGLLFSPLTGKISGTPAYVSPATDYTIIVNGNGGTADTAVVNIASVSAPPVLSYPGGPYAFELAAPISTLSPVNTGAAVTAWSMTPNLNAATGLQFNPTTGRITGTPAYIAAASDYTVIATAAGGASDTVVLNIGTSTPAPTVSYTDAPLEYPLGSDITPLSKTGATGIITGYSVTPALPAGLVLNPTTGRISGRPSASSPSADYVITVQGPGGTGRDTVHIATSTPAPTVSYTNTPQNYTVGNAITTLTKSGASGIVTGYTIAPVLPAGLLFNPTTGAILGTPSAASPATDYVVSANGPGGTGRDTVNITVTTPAPTVSYANTPQSYPVGSAITPFSKSGATGLVTGYSILPNLATATGLSFSATTGRIEGTPTIATAASEYVITVHGPGGTGKDTIQIATTVTPPNIAFAQPSVSFVTGTPIEAFRPANTGGMITGWGISTGSNGASLTANTGLLFNPTTGKILGTPVYVSAPRDYTVTANGLGGTSDADVITIATTAPLGKLVAGEANTFSFRVTGALGGYTLRIPEVDAATEQVTVTITDLSGRRVWRRSVDPRPAAQADRNLDWNGRDASGRAVAVGMYLVRIEAVREGKTTGMVRKGVTLDPR